MRCADAEPTGWERGERGLFAALALLCLLPIWTVRLLPTADGPTHVYNAGILLELLTGGDGAPRFREHFELNPRLVPNWTGHAILTLLLTVCAPAVAEKLLVSGYVLLFLGGLRYLVRAVQPGGGWLAFLGLPLVYHWPLQMGFYNFSYSLALFFIAVGFWWRRRAGLTRRGALALHALLALCYLSHLVSHLMTLAAIGVLWLVGRRRERGHWRQHLSILVPHLALALGFVWAQGADPITDRWPLARSWTYFRGLEAICAFGAEQLAFAAAVASLFGALVLLTLLRENVRREGRRLRLRFGEVDGFLLVALLFTAVYCFAPDAASGGGFLPHRLGLFPYLAVIPWLSARWSKAGMAVIVGLLTVATLWNVGFQARWYRALEGEAHAFLSGLEPVPPHARVVALLFDRYGPAARVPVLSHTIGYTALDKKLLDWDNYEAGTNYFPVRFKSAVARPHLLAFYLVPAQAEIRQWRGRADYIYAWKMPPDVPVAGRLRQDYRLVAERGGGQLWESRNPGALGGEQAPWEDEGRQGGAE